MVANGFVVGFATDHGDGSTEETGDTPVLDIPIPAVGFIERKSEMKNRVMKILDRKTRIGRGISIAGLLTILVIGLVLIPGAARPASSTSENARSSKVETPATTKNAQHENSEAVSVAVARQQEKSADDADATMQSKELVVTAIDEAGEPLPDVSFFVSASTIKDGPALVKNTVTSDAQGIARLKLPIPLRSVRIWASKDRFSSLNFNWESEEVKSIPTNYKLTFQKGTKLSGIVVDSQNQPVSGAKVDISLFGGGLKAEQKTRVKLGGWLAEGESRAITDENGRWSINNAPKGDDLDLRFMVEHPEFITNVARKTSDEYKVTLPQLRKGTAKFRIEKGISIRGKITDGHGNPIQSGLVIWGDDPYHQPGSQEVEIGKNGEYAIPPQPLGEIRLTVVAPGWMPVDRIFNLSADHTSTQDFKLKRGKKLQLIFVDSEGNPVPKVYVGILEWHGKKHILYNHAAPNVKRTKIPQVSNDQGVYTWDWAPDDSIKLSIGSRELGYSKEFEIVPNDVPKTIAIPRQFELSGKVVDSETGDPVTSFSIVPVKFSSDNRRARGSVEIRHTKNFQSSEFNFGNLNTGGNVKRVAFRFQANGYKEFMTKKFASDAPSLRTTIRLQPAATNSVKVKEPDGKTCTDAYVWLARPEQGIRTNSFEDYFSNFLGRQTINQKGEFQYSSPSTKHAIVIANRSGYAEKYLEVDEDLEELTLQSWAKLEGVVYQNGKPVSGARVQVVPIRQRGGSNPHVQDHFSTTTDEYGRFKFEKLPPLPSVVRSHSSYPKDDPILSNRFLPILLEPGGSHNISLGGGGQIVTGKVKLVGGNPNRIQFQYGMNVLVKTDGGVQTPKHAREKIYFQTGAAKVWTDKLEADLDSNIIRERFFAKVHEDGTFSFSGVQPGQYRLLARLYPAPTECLIDPVGYGFLEFSIEDKANENGMDLGGIEAKLEPVSKVSDLLPDFRYQDSEGNRHQISKYRGKFVLIDFWASWSQRSIKAFPELAKVNDSIAKRDDSAIVSISVDEDFNAAKTVALREKLTWPVGVAGKSALEGSAAKVLGVSAVPMYVVLDPNGKIVYRGTVLSEAATYLPNSKD